MCQFNIEEKKQIVNLIIVLGIKHFIRLGAER